MSPIPTIQLTVPTDPETRYFPTEGWTRPEVRGWFGRKKKSPWEAIDDFWNENYSRILFEYEEPVLRHYSGEDEIYRFTWARSFHPPYIFRVTRSGERKELCIKGNGEEKVILLGEKEWRAFSAKVRAMDFWNLLNVLDHQGLDGSIWILEGVLNGRYHWAYRWTPNWEDHGYFRVACGYLIKISNLELGPRDIY